MALRGQSDWVSLMASQARFCGTCDISYPTAPSTDRAQRCLALIFSHTLNLDPNLQCCAVGLYLPSHLDLSLLKGAGPSWGIFHTSLR
jgi:hypothetical protein